MRESGIIEIGVDQMGQAELLHIMKSLEDSRRDYVGLKFTDAEGPVHSVGYAPKVEPGHERLD